MPNPFHDPHMAHIVRAVASQRAQVRPALTSANELQLVRESIAWHLEIFDSMVEMQPRHVDLEQAITNSRSALSYIEAIAFEPTTIDKGIVTALLGWHRYSRDIAETSGLDSTSSRDGLSEKVQEILQALQTRVSA
jgi:hypothetical protein